MADQEPTKQVDWAGKVIALFASVKLTLAIIGALVVLSFLGITGRFGFQDIYHSRPFSLLLGFLFINLLVCSIDRLPGLIRRIRLDLGPVAPPPPRQADYRFRARAADPEEVLRRAEVIAFGREGAFPRRKMELRAKAKGQEAAEPGEGAGGTTALVSFHATGKLSLLGSQLTHLGILLIILGGIVGSQMSLNGRIDLSPGEESSTLIVDVADSPTETPLPFTVRCNSFKITYYPDKSMPSDYLCDLSILVNGREAARKTIQVNQPLYYQGYGIYQASYYPMFRFTLTAVADGTTMGADLRQYEPWTRPHSDITYLLGDYQPSAMGMGRDLGPNIAVGIFKQEMEQESVKLFERIPGFDQDRNDPYRLSFRVLPDRNATGLQVIKDPGIPLIWSGCALLVLGVSVAFFIPHRRLWLVARPGPGGLELALIGRANRAQNMFSDRLHAVADRLEAELGAGPSASGAEVKG